MATAIEIPCQARNDSFKYFTRGKSLRKRLGKGSIIEPFQCYMLSCYLR